MIRFFHLALLAALGLGTLNSTAAILSLKVSGEVSVAKGAGDGKWSALKSGQSFGKSLGIKTGKDSFADFEVDGGSLLRVPAESIVWIDRAESEKGLSDVQLDVQKGRVLCVAKNVSGASKFEVKSGAGVCAAREDDSEFDVSEAGEYRCAAGTLVIVYIVNGLPVLPQTLRAREMVDVNRIGSGPVAKKIDEDTFAEMLKEIGELKVSERETEKRK